MTAKTEIFLLFILGNFYDLTTLTESDKIVWRCSFRSVECISIIGSAVCQCQKILVTFSFIAHKPEANFLFVVFV